MKIGNHHLSRDTPRHVFYRVIKPIFSGNYQYVFPWRGENPASILVTNYCNLRCYSCSALCDRPAGSNTYRDRDKVIDPEKLELFLRGVKGWMNWITLEGGEPTAAPLEILSRCVHLAHSEGYKVNILSNGFRLFEYLKRGGEPLDFYSLDRHGVNDADIARSVEYLRENGGKYRVIDTLVHFDLELMRSTNISPGARCRFFLGLGFEDEAVYPCCAARTIEGWDNTNEVGEELIRAGWSIRNPNLLATVKDWRHTLPGEFWKLCLFSCWRDGEKVKGVKIS